MTLADKIAQAREMLTRNGEIFATPSQGQISASDINAALGRSVAGELSVDDPEARLLAGVQQGEIRYSDFYGKELSTLTVGNSGIYYGFSTGGSIPDIGDLQPRAQEDFAGVIIGVVAYAAGGTTNTVDITFDTAQTPPSLIVGYNDFNGDYREAPLALTGTDNLFYRIDGTSDANFLYNTIVGENGNAMKLTIRAGA